MSYSVKGLKAVAELARKVLPQTNEHSEYFLQGDKLEQWLAGSRDGMLSGKGNWADIDTTATGGLLIVAPDGPDGWIDRPQVYAHLGSL